MELGYNSNLRYNGGRFLCVAHTDLKSQPVKWKSSKWCEEKRRKCSGIWMYELGVVPTPVIPALWRQTKESWVWGQLGLYSKTLFQKERVWIYAFLGALVLALVTGGPTSLCCGRGCSKGQTYALHVAVSLASTLHYIPGVTKRMSPSAAKCPLGNKSQAENYGL
jgi:hypothetical protein